MHSKFHKVLIAGLTIIISAAVSSGYGEAMVWKGWKNSLKPAGKAGPMLKLSKDGKTDYKIVIAANATTQDEKAADDLAYWLKEMTGATFAVVDDSTSPQQKEISVGKTNRLEAANIAEAKADLGDEGYAIAVKGKKLFLLGGNKRGAINVVYALLEEDLGCRWYAGRSSRIPKTATLEFQPVVRDFKPALKYRDPFYYAAFDSLWSLRNRTNAERARVPEEWGGHIDYALFVHSTSFLLPPERYFAEHPEYFQLNEDGTRNKLQICLTNKEAINVVTQNAMIFLKENPNAEIIDISKGDGGARCYCDQCKKLTDVEGDSGVLLHFVNAVAEGIEKEHPNVLVTTLAYLETKVPPKTIKPRKNVSIRVCTDAGSIWDQFFLPVRGNENFRKALLGWKEMCWHVYIWDYAFNVSNWLLPCPNVDVIADNIRFFVETGCEGVMIQAGSQCPVAERDLLKSWVISKLLWDPSRDEQELTQDFIWGYFGQAARPIAEYNAYLYEIGKDKKSLLLPAYNICYASNVPFLSREFVDKANAFYDKAEALAENEEILRRVERDRLPIMFVQLEQGIEFTGEDYANVIDRFESIMRREGANLVREHINYFSLKHFGTFPGVPELSYLHSLDEKLKVWKEKAVQDMKNLTAPGKTGPVRFYRFGAEW